MNCLKLKARNNYQYSTKVMFTAHGIRATTKKLGAFHSSTMLFTDQTFVRQVTTVYYKSDMKTIKTYYVPVKNIHNKKHLTVAKVFKFQSSTSPDGHPLEGMGVHHVNRNLKADLSVRARS